jgi:hypothetical protein
LRVLDRVEQLVAAGRREREAAQQKLDAATRGLLAADGDIDAAVAGYGDVLRETAPWISDDAVGSLGVGDAARQVRVRAVMTAFGLAPGIYQQLRDRCRDVVVVIAGISAGRARIPPRWMTSFGVTGFGRSACAIRASPFRAGWCRSALAGRT